MAVRKDPAHSDDVDPRLAVLRQFATADGLLPVEVMVAHDGLREGTVALVEPSSRTAALLEKGFFDLYYGSL